MQIFETGSTLPLGDLLFIPTPTLLPNTSEAALFILNKVIANPSLGIVGRYLNLRYSGTLCVRDIQVDIDYALDFNALTADLLKLPDDDEGILALNTIFPGAVLNPADNTGLSNGIIFTTAELGTIADLDDDRKLVHQVILALFSTDLVVRTTSVPSAVLNVTRGRPELITVNSTYTSATGYTTEELANISFLRRRLSTSFEFVVDLTELETNHIVRSA